MLKIGQSAITGRVQGVYDKEQKQGVIKRGISKNNNKWQVFEIGVSSKENGAYVNGKAISVMLIGDNRVEIGDKIGLVGRFLPNNYRDANGKEVKGLQFMANCEDIFTPEAWA